MLRTVATYDKSLSYVCLLWDYYMYSVYTAFRMYSKRVVIMPLWKCRFLHRQSCIITCQNGQECHWSEKPHMWRKPVAYHMAINLPINKPYHPPWNEFHCTKTNFGIHIKNELDEINSWYRNCKDYWESFHKLVSSLWIYFTANSVGLYVF